MHEERRSAHGRNASRTTATLSLVRGLSVIRVFGAGRSTLSVSEVATSANVTRATARRILLTLQELGYVSETENRFSLTDLVPGRGIGLELDGELVGLYLVDGRVYALGDVCTHAYALLSNGFVVGNEVECPLHFARFDLATGACVEGPALDDVPSLPVNVEAGAVYLDLDALGSMNRAG